MKILYSFTLCLLVLIALPFVSQAQDADANSKLISMEINGETWKPHVSRAEYMIEKGQDIEIISLGMFRLDDGTISQLTFKMVRFDGIGKYKVGEVFSLIGVYQQRKGTEAGPNFKMVNESGMVEITAYDAKNLTFSGKFSFELKDVKSDKVIKVTEGKFKRVQLIDVTPVDVDAGKE